MDCFNRTFFTPYTETDQVLDDFAYFLTDPIDPVIRLVVHLRDCILWSVPFAIGILSLNLPLLILLAFPVATNLLALSIPIKIGLVLFAAPLIFAVCGTLLDVAELVLSPIINALRILTNVGATVVENLSSESSYGY